MKNFHLVLLVLIVTTVLIPSCNKPSIIGGDLLEQDQLNVAFTDTVTILAKTILSDEIETFDIGDQLDFFLCGDLDDPIFGGVKATNYLQPRLSFPDPNFQPGDVIDSVILTITYDSTGMYGNLLEGQTINIHRLTEDLSSVDTLLSSDAFEFDPVAIGTHEFTLDFDSVVATTYYGDVENTNTFGPMIRVPIDIAYAQEIFDLEESDSTIFSNDVDFLDAFKGLYVECEGANKESILSFQYRNIFSSFQIFYHRDTLNKQYDLIFSNASVKSVNFDHYGADASTVGSFIDDTTLGDSLLFVQGMQGTNISLRFPYAQDLEDLVVNKATLELTVATLPGDLEELVPGEQVLLSERADDGGLVLIEDISFATNVGIIALFGGALETDTDLNIQKYSMNVSTAFQDIIRDEVSDEMILNLFLPEQRANRSVIFGPNHSTFPAKLNITYTGN